MHIFLLIKFNRILNEKPAQINEIKALVETKNSKSYLPQSQQETINLGNAVAHMCILSNNELVAVCYDKIVIYNENFEETKSIDEINNQKICSTSATVDEQNRIYICNYIIEEDKSQVIQTDMNLNSIKTFTSDGYFTSIKYKNDFLYVCNKETKEIMILNTNLNLVKSHKLDYNPLTILVNDHTICIKWLSMHRPHHKNDVTDLNFYDIKTFQQYSHHRANGNFCVTEDDDSLFLSLNPSKMDFCFFNHQGEFVEALNLNKLENFENTKSSILYYKGKILVIQSDVRKSSSVIYSL